MPDPPDVEMAENVPDADQAQEEDPATDPPTTPRHVERPNKRQPSESPGKLRQSSTHVGPPAVSILEFLPGIPGYRDSYFT